MRLPIERRFAAVIGLFFVEALAFSSWLPRLPELRDRLGLSEGELGLVLMGLPAGALVIIPITGMISTRLSIPGLNVLCMAMLLGATAFLPLAQTPLWLAGSLFLVGLGSGSMGVAMNAAGIAVEKALGRKVLSRCHAFFSIGIATGGGVGTAAAMWRLDLAIQTPLVAAAIALVLPLIIRALPDDAAARTRSGPAFALPTWPLLPPALVAFFCLLTEGAVLDWSAIYIQSVIQSDTLIGGGVMAFASAMAIARLVGDWLVTRFGDITMVGAGAGLAGCGFLLVTLAIGLETAIAGFALAGFGIAGIVPIAFRVAGSTPGVPSGLGVAAVSSIGYVGLLLGPALMGFMGEIGGLRFAFALIVGMMGLILALAPFLRPRPPDTAGARAG